ncbi:MAG TPA: type II toxin-antitoxin system PemK/MazF family toxin [Candidatus Dormibacteraeota bacterium]|nr:type II toxin-antitoxin system PemK/MazF family toxin [Candidatus Dormibacteraeota bacterium]
MSAVSNNVQRGQVYWVNMDPTVGAEIKKLRPALVVSNNINNKYSPLITILPITSNTQKPYPFEVVISQGAGGLKQASLIKANQIRTIDKKRIHGAPLGVVMNSDTMNQVDQAIKVHLSL